MNRHYIYVIGREDGPVKVGISSFPAGRVRQIQTGCPFTISLLHFRECRDRAQALEHEQIFHGCYEDVRLAGEWFNISGELAAEGVDTAFDYELHFAEEAKRDYMASELNIWQ